MINIEFNDREDQSVMLAIKQWKELIEGRINENYEDPDIHELVKDVNEAMIMNNKERGEVKVWSTGIKKNGKIDICLEYQDNKEQKFFFDCEATMSDETSSSK